MTPRPRRGAELHEDDGPGRASPGGGSGAGRDPEAVRPSGHLYDARMAPVSRVRDVGEQALASLRRSVSERLADTIRSDPEWAEQAADVGLIDRAWLESPAEHSFRTAPPAELMERFLERMSERRPSVLTRVGLSALQGLSLARTVPADLAVSTPLTVMFTDLEGFTRYTAEHGDEVAATLIADHQKVVGPIVRSRGGRIVKRLGDGLMLTFPSPESAVLAAVELVEAVQAPLRMRAGLHVGAAVVTHDDLFGHIVNVAARITEEAKGGMVLASVEVREATGPVHGVTFGRARQARLKGVEPMSVCRVERAVP